MSMRGLTACRFVWRSAILFGWAVTRVLGQCDYETGAGQSSLVARYVSIGSVAESDQSSKPACAPWAAVGSFSKLESPGVDLSSEARIPGETSASSSLLGPLALFEALSDPQWPLPDPTIAAIDTYILAAVNSKFAIFNREGEALFSTTLESWFEDVLDPATYDCGPLSPQLLYNHFNQQWILAALASDTQTQESFILLSVSVDENPKGLWHTWALPAALGDSTRPNLQPYDLKLGLGANTVFLSTNQYGGTEGPFARIRMIPVDAINDGGALEWWDIWHFSSPANNSLAFSVIPPIAFDRVDTIFCAETRLRSDDRVTIWRITPHAPNAPSVICVDHRLTEEYLPPHPAPQPEVADSLDAGDNRVRDAILVNDTLWISLTTRSAFGPIGSEIRIIAIDVENGLISFDESYTTVEKSFFMPGLTIDSTGNPVSLLSSASAKTYPAFEAVILNPHQGQEVVKSGGILKMSRQSLNAPNASVAPWGSRVGIARDHQNPQIIWGIGELVDDDSPDEWTTWIAAVSIDKADLEIGTNVDDTLIVIRGQQQTVPLVVTNKGRAFAGRTYIGAYFSVDSKLDTAGDARLNEQVLNSLDEGEEREFDVQFKVEKNIVADQGFLFFVVDYRESLLELAEDNNVLSVPAIIVDSLSCDLTFLQPQAYDRLCRDTVQVVIAESISGGRKPYEIIECSINDNPAATTCTDTSVFGEVVFKPGQNQITAYLMIRDSLGFLDSCWQSIIVESPSALGIDIQILEPKPNSFFCDREITVKGTKKIVGGFAPYTEKCWLNGDSIDVPVSAFNFPWDFPAEDSTIELICQVSDSCGSFASDTASVPIEAGNVSPLIPSVEIIQPVPGTGICGSLVELIATAVFTGGVPPVQRECQINGDIIIFISDTLDTLLGFPLGENMIEVACSFTDSCGRVANDTATTTVFVDTTGPVVEWQYSPVYPFIKGTLRDPETGIDSAWALDAVNAQLFTDDFTPGDTSVAFHIDPIDASQPIGITVNLVNRAGCETVFDPLIIRLSGGENPCAISANIPAQEHFFNIENHGLAEIRLKAAGFEYHFVADNDRSGHQGSVYFVPYEGGITLDLQDLWNTDTLRVELICSGQPEGFAFVIFSDRPWDFTTELESRPSFAQAPEHFVLYPCYPNPFNPATNIRFEIPTGSLRRASLRIYNLQGQIVCTLLDGHVAPGHYDLPWHGLDNSGISVSSGVYFCILRAGEYSASRKMTLAK